MTPPSRSRFRPPPPPNRPRSLPQRPRPQTSSPPAKMDDKTATFLRGQPHELGVVQIFIGVLCILLSLTAAFSPMLILHAALSLAVAFLASGSVTVAAGRRTSVRLVWASLVLNLISVLISLAGVAYVCWMLAGPPLSNVICGGLDGCVGRFWVLNVAIYGLLSLFLILLVLQTCVAVTVCVFSGKTLRRHNLGPPVMVRVDEHDSDVALLDNEEVTPNSP
ncbi:membrane-spanning 4-domains subfamily A member 4A-like [Lates japonicus]